MKIENFIKLIESEIPVEIAWQKDNIGFQAGNKSEKLNGILIALDLDSDVILEAKKNKCNLIITHHPLIFKEQKNILSDERVGALIQSLIKSNINLYCAHTNFDSIKNGVSFALAEKLNLKNVRILSSLNNSLLKISVFVPNDFTEKVAIEMFNAGAGNFLNYKNCSFRSDGVGTFKPSGNAKPTIGKIGQLEKVNETKLEMICYDWNLNSVLNAMRKSHPYEEIAYDIFKMENKTEEFGLGAIGEFEKPIIEKEFLKLVKEKLNQKFVRFAVGKNNAIKKVAVCGGSGSEYIQNAIKKNADAFITADIKYHTFQEYENKILLIDAGHFETEIHSLKNLQRICSNIIDDKKIKTFVSKSNNNPVKYF